MKSYDMILLSWFVFNLRPPSPNHPLLESITSQIPKKNSQVWLFIPFSLLVLLFPSWLIANWFYFSFLPPSLSLFVVPDFLHFRRFCNPFLEVSTNCCEGWRFIFALEKFDFQFSGRWPAVCHWLSLDHFSSDLSRFVLYKASHLVANNDERQQSKQTFEASLSCSKI